MATAKAKKAKAKVKVKKAKVSKVKVKDNKVPGKEENMGSQSSEQAKKGVQWFEN